MMNRILFLILIGTAIPALGDSIYVAPPSGNIPQGDLKSMRELINLSVQNHGHLISSSPEKADTILNSKIIKFSTYTFSITRWKGNSNLGGRQWKAENRNQLEALIDPAVKETLQGKTSPPKKTLREQAQEKSNLPSGEKNSATSQVFLGFGPAFFNNLNSTDMALGLSAGYYWNINDNVDLGILSDFSISQKNSDANMITAKISANYFPLVSDISPYIGAGFGYGYASAHTGQFVVSRDRANGFAGSLNVGIKFFRTSNINLGLGLDYNFIMDKNSQGTPSELIVKLGIYY